MKEAIQANVIAYIASFANMPAEAILDTYILRDHPLKMDDTKLGFLAIALRAYVKSMNPEETVLATDMRKGGLDVKRTYELIIKKSGL